MPSWSSQGSLRGPQGAAGTGVAGASINAGGELLLTYTNGATVSAGVVRGSEGPAGTSVQIHGSVGTAADLDSVDTSAISTGDGFIVQDTGHLHIWDATSGIWTDAGLIKGPRGDQGNAGDPGVRGTMWYTGVGAPPDPAPEGSRTGDLYLDTATGDIYTLA